MRRDDNGPIAVFFIEEISHLLQQGLAPFKMLAVVVADEHVHRARFDVAIQFIDVEEASWPSVYSGFSPAGRSCCHSAAIDKALTIFPLASLYGRCGHGR